MSKTVKQIVENADALKPNAFTNEQKTAWLSEIEGRLQLDVFLMAAAEVITYIWSEDQNTEVLLDPPHDGLYEQYLEAMIDYANGEYSKYTNTMSMFNASLGNFARWFARNYEPAQGYREERT